MRDLLGARTIVASGRCVRGSVGTYALKSLNATLIG